MKVLVNGGLNLSELDGWWAEAYTPEVGWALGDGQEHGDDPGLDAVEANALYQLLEQEVVPAFYMRDSEGLPKAWVARMRESMSRLTPRFSASRTVREYTEKYYLPALAAYEQRAADKGAGGAGIVRWRQALGQKWNEVRFGQAKVETAGQQHSFEVEVFFGELDAEAVRVELYADGTDRVERRELTRKGPMAGSVGGYVYGGSVPATRPATDYTPRVVPHCPGVAVPLEAGRILWQR